MASAGRQTDRRPARIARHRTAPLPRRPVHWRVARDVVNYLAHEQGPSSAFGALIWLSGAGLCDERVICSVVPLWKDTGNPGGRLGWQPTSGHRESLDTD